MNPKKIPILLVCARMADRGRFAIRTKNTPLCIIASLTSLPSPTSFVIIVMIISLELNFNNWLVLCRSIGMCRMEGGNALPLKLKTRNNVKLLTHHPHHHHYYHYHHHYRHSWLGILFIFRSHVSPHWGFFLLRVYGWAVELTSGIYISIYPAIFSRPGQFRL